MYPVSPTLRGAAALAAALSLALGLAACSAPRPVPKPVEVFRPVPPPPPPVEAPASAPQAAETHPIQPDGAMPPMPAASAASAPAAAPPPAEETESAAVAARFPDPPARFDTPGLQDGRREYTTQEELDGILKQLSGRTTPVSGVQVQLLPLGNSQQGASLQALRFTHAPPSGDVRPVVLLVGQQRGDEPAGAEALIVVARQLAEGKLGALLDRIDVIVMPRANPDGAKLYTRASANGIDVDRDHLLLRTPEASAVAQLEREYAPMVVADLHEFAVGGPFRAKFGALQREDVQLQYAMTANLPEFAGRAAEEWFRRPMLAALKRAQLNSEWYYTTSADPADKLVSMGSVYPGSARNAGGLKNAVSFVVATRGAGLGRQHLQRRVQSQVVAVTSLLNSAAARAAELRKLRAFVEADIRSQACRAQMTVEVNPTRSEHDLVMLDPDTGADRTVTVDWNSAIGLDATKTRARPCGYWLDADASDAVLRLRQLGIQVQQLNDKLSLVADTFHETSRQKQSTKGENEEPGGGATTPQVELVNALVEMPAGSYYVPMTQPLANLIVAALEPDTPSSYVANGLIASVDKVARLRALPDPVALNPLP